LFVIPALRRRSHPSHSLCLLLPLTLERALDFTESQAAGVVQYRMLPPASAFVVSSLPVANNVVKALIFRCAEAALAVACYKFSSLIAAKGDQFTAYLMFAEDYIQRLLYVRSRRFSPGSVLVVFFTGFFMLAQLFVIVFWALDFPGYVTQPRNISAAEVVSQLLDNRAYIVYLTVGAEHLASNSQGLSQTIGANLFNSTLNVTLTAAVDRGTRRVVNATRPRAGGRIWLDDEGFSVSPDSWAMSSYKTNETGGMIGLECPFQYTGFAWRWNCTFENIFSQRLLTDIVGRPEIHWDDVSDLDTDSRYISPNRQDNIWASLGQGGGTSMMRQMFTVTKGRNRHTFIQSITRCTLLTIPTAPFHPSEVMDLLKRTWSTNETEQHAPLIGTLFKSIMNAQEQKKSFSYGLNSASNVTTTQVSWQYLTWENSGAPQYSTIRISMTNITLVRSDTIEHAPTPFRTCDASFQNQAYGGKLTGSDCRGSGMRNQSRFFGQVDTSAVLIQYGLGDGTSNISSEALDQSIWVWSVDHGSQMDDLLLARGFIVSVAPSLVTLELSEIVPALSYLQVFLILLSVILAATGWVCLRKLASSNWSNTLLSNLVASTTPRGDDEKRQVPSYLRRPPEVQLQEMNGKAEITVDGSPVVLGGDAPGSSSIHVESKQIYTSPKY
jgi:hypothetical protein